MRSVVEARRIAAPGPEWDGLFARAPVQSTRQWFDAIGRAALPPGRVVVYIACWKDGVPLALFPMVAGPNDFLAGPDTPYTVLYEPLLAPGLGAATVRGVGAAFGRACRGAGPVRLDAMDAAWPALPLLLDGMAESGLLPERFDHFGNWHQPVEGWSWDRYLASRSGAHRETIRRKGQAAARDGTVRLQLVQHPDELGPALDAYEAIYARSWKEPEPYPGFNQALLPGLAAAGWVRMGVMWAGEQPLAAQYWTVRDGVATVLKLAHDQAFKARSPGTVLTAWMIRGLLEAGIKELDFGRGDDPYKQLWVSERRQRVGVVLVDPWKLSGMMSVVRQRAGRLRRWLRARRVLSAS